jgi:hypothetical protein
MPLAIGIIAALMLLAWGGVELDHVIHAYPGQFLMGVFAFLVVAFALAAARFRKAGERVPLRPAVPSLPPAIQAKPEQSVLNAAPVLRAVAAPEAEDAAGCEGPSCTERVNDDPWTARVHGEGREHVFCSEACVREWQQANRPWEARQS